MKINKFLTILTFFLLFSCGFEPIYSQKKLDSNYNIKQEIALKLGKKYKEQFNKTRIAKNILSILK